jgi:mannose-6-phosphate isomerase-like protein (cupin superfamily)
VYLVLDGNLTLGLQGDERVLPPGTLVRLAPSVRRQLINRGPERLVMLAMGGEGEHHGRDGRAWETWEQGGDGRPPTEVELPRDLPRAGA